MITSPDNEKLKLVRKLARRKHRERQGLFVTEGEDLLAAGLAAGHRPRAVLARGEAGPEGVEAEPVEPALLDRVSALGSGTRVISIWRQPEPASAGELCVYLHGVADPGNVGTILRTVDALSGATVLLGPGCADPFGPKAVRASMGSVFSGLLGRGTIEDAPRPRVAMLAAGGQPEPPLAGAGTICLGAEREGLPEEVANQCELSWTIPLRPGGPESLNVAAAAAVASAAVAGAAAERISSPAGESVSEASNGKAEQGC